MTGKGKTDNTTSDAQVLTIEKPDRLPHIKLVQFDQINLGSEPRYLIKGLVPLPGLTIVWGPPKSGKSFFVLDLLLSVALWWRYRDRGVKGGPVIYCAFEGARGVMARVEAFRQHRHKEIDRNVPFYLVPIALDLVRDHQKLIDAIRAALGGVKPVAVCLDTLNRSMAGSESRDEDMTAYIRACDTIREAFNCAVIVVHHSGIEGSRPRGHTSLTGAADAQIAVCRGRNDQVVAKVEWMKDGPEGGTVHSRLEQVNIGIDDDGEPITSCVVAETEAAPVGGAPRHKIPENQQTMLTILQEAMPRGLTVIEWNDRAREAGMKIAKQRLYEARVALKKKNLVHEDAGRWYVTQQG